MWPLVAERCLEVVLVCPAPLRSLLSRIAHLGSCVAEWHEVPGFGAYALLSSLPYLLNTELESIPSSPYLSVDLLKAGMWGERVNAASADNRLRVGLCWAGRPEHGNDRRRSVGLATLAPLGSVAGVRFVSLAEITPIG